MRLQRYTYPILTSKLSKILLFKSYRTNLSTLQIFLKAVWFFISREDAVDDAEKGSWEIALFVENLQICVLTLKLQS